MKQTVFDFSKNIKLEDERVLIRPLLASDYEHLVNFSIQEPEIWTYSLVRILGKEDLHQYIQSALEARANEKEYPFIVYDKQLEAYAGCTRFYDIQPFSGSLLLGYTWYGKQFQGTGLNRHCKFLLLDHAFGELGIERVELRADSRNARSIAAMKGIGCTVEGILRSTMPTPDGGRRDSIVLSILKEEWQHELRERLRQKL